MNSESTLFSLVLAGMISASAHAQIARQTKLSPKGRLGGNTVAVLVSEA
jgi:hypothetical protein